MRWKVGTQGNLLKAAAAVAAVFFWCERPAEKILKHMAELQAHAGMYHTHNTKAPWFIH